MKPQREATGASLDEIEVVYRAGLPEFRRVAAAIVRDRELARDAVQEAFALAVRRRAGFRREGPLEAWLWRIVINTARDQLRKADPAGRLGGEPPAPPNRGPRPGAERGPGPPP